MSAEIKKSEKNIPCEVYTRVVGFYRPLSQFNKGKFAEHMNKKYMKIPEDMR